MRPLRERGIVPAEFPVTVHAISGYSGGGRRMIESFEQPTPGARPQNYGDYGLTLKHKHIGEMREHGLLSQTPLFAPAVGYFRQGMLVHVPLQLAALPHPVDGAGLHATYSEHFRGEPFITVRPLNDTTALREGSSLEPEALNDTNRLEVFVFANDAARRAAGGAPGQSREARVRRGAESEPDARPAGRRVPHLMLYTPPHFLGRRDLAAQLIRAHPFATLITPGTEAIVTHAPLLLVEEGESWRLLGHMAHANPHWQAWEKTSTVLAIFNGGDATSLPRCTRRAKPYQPGTTPLSTCTDKSNSRTTARARRRC
jgi:hypothetical protein